MKKASLFVFILCIGGVMVAQNCQKETKKHQKKQNKEFKNPKESPLTKEDLKDFKELDFYPYNQKLCIEASFVRTPDEVPFLMPTTTSRKALYVKYGEAHFDINDQPQILNLYQSLPVKKGKYEKHLFMPFKDATSGKGSYGGGRFIDMTIPEGNTIRINFNTAYNPYCAYSDRYSCPITPSENKLEVAIEAGVKAYNNH